MDARAAEARAPRVPSKSLVLPARASAAGRPRPVGMAGFEPAISSSRTRRVGHAALHPGSDWRESNPREPPWQGGAQPLSHSRESRDASCGSRCALKGWWEIGDGPSGSARPARSVTRFGKRRRPSPRRDSNPHKPAWKAGAFAVRPRERISGGARPPSLRLRFATAGALRRPAPRRRHGRRRKSVELGRCLMAQGPRRDSNPRSPFPADRGGRPVPSTTGTRHGCGRTRTC